MKPITNKMTKEADLELGFSVPRGEKKEELIEEQQKE